MARDIIIDENWNPSIQKLAHKFNKYALKRSLYNVAEIITKFIDIMDSDLGELGYDAASALARIEKRNPSLITSFTSQKIRRRLFPDNYASINPQYNSQPSTDSPFYTPEYQDPTLIQDPTYNPNAPTFSKLKAEIEEESSYSSYNPPSNIDLYNENTSDELENNGANDDSTALEDLLSMSVEQLKIKNVHQVYYDNSLKGRKCALGDGTFEDYTGKIWQCECGTLYHDSCLKIQAVYVGKCHICDRVFLEK